MLVRFHSKAAAGVTMFGYVAVDLLRQMGMSGIVPGAVPASGVPEALRKLGQALASPEGDRVPGQTPPGSGKHGKEEEDERETSKVSLRTRAYPLVQLLEAAVEQECDVVWEDAGKATG